MKFIKFISDLLGLIRKNILLLLAALLTYPLGKLIQDMLSLTLLYLLPHLSTKLLRDMLGTTILIIIVLCALLITSRSKNIKLKNQIEILNKSLEDELLFSHGVNFNKRTRNLECPRANCRGMINIKPSSKGLYDVVNSASFKCTSCSYEHIPRDKLSNPLDPFKIKESLLNS